jgi:cyclopropane fatty-acyl-phospholipid synthase-like methyltransferase
LKIPADQLAAMLENERFPLSAKYDPTWVIENEMGPNALWLMEELAAHMRLSPGMRVLDMGCGRAMTSIFLAKEFGCTVWANDLWIPATENWARVREAGCEDKVFPIHAEAHALPYADEFFDAIVSVDSYQYYGTDDTYLSRFVRYVKPGGQIGIVVPGLEREFENGVPDYLNQRTASGTRFWDPAECYSFHTAAWWRKHWERSELVTIERADSMPDGCAVWLQFQEAVDASATPRCDAELPGLRADRGAYLGFVVMVARRKGALE